MGQPAETVECVRAMPPTGTAKIVEIQMAAVPAIAGMPALVEHVLTTPGDGRAAQVVAQVVVQVVV